MVEPARPASSTRERLLERAVADAARLAGVAPSDVVVVSSESVEWRDGSLGCPEPGRMYAQVITPGYRFVLQAGGRSYEYHSDLRDRVILCDRPSSG